MARILLVADPNSSDVAGITFVLMRDRHSVTMAKTLDEPRLFSNGNLLYQIVLVDLTHNRPSDWRNSDDALGAVTPDAVRPVVLAFASVFRGVRMKVEAERRGAARFLWI